MEFLSFYSATFSKNKVKKNEIQPIVGQFMESLGEFKVSKDFKDFKVSKDFKDLRSSRTIKPTPADRCGRAGLMIDDCRESLRIIWPCRATPVVLPAWHRFAYKQMRRLPRRVCEPPREACHSRWRRRKSR